MNINKEKLKYEYLSGDFDSFFREAAEITNFLLVRKYYSLDEETRADLLQDCMESLWEKHLSKKINTEKGDLMSFIWQNSSYKILDYLKKQKRRDGIIYFFSYEECITDAAFLKKNGEVSDDGDYDC